MKKPSVILNLVGRKKPEFWNFSLETLVVFLSNFKFMSTRFTTGQKPYEQILCEPHRSKFQDSGHKGSSIASHLKGFTEFESLLLAFSPR